MKVIISGTRTIKDAALLEKAIADSGYTITRVIHGGARGVDTLAAQWASAHRVPTSVYLADWDGHGKAAGPIRNGDMLKDADALVAVWDGASPGTANMIRQAMNAGLRTYVHRVDPTPISIRVHIIETTPLDSICAFVLVGTHKESK